MLRVWHAKHAVWICCSHHVPIADPSLEVGWVFYVKYGHGLGAVAKPTGKRSFRFSGSLFHDTFMQDSCPFLHPSSIGSRISLAAPCQPGGGCLRDGEVGHPEDVGLWSARHVCGQRVSFMACALSQIGGSLSSAGASLIVAVRFTGVGPVIHSYAGSSLGVSGSKPDPAPSAQGSLQYECLQSSACSATCHLYMSCFICLDRYSLDAFGPKTLLTFNTCQSSHVLGYFI